MARKKPADAVAPALFDARVTAAPCVPAIRAKVEQWWANSYPGVTETARRLLNYWFQTAHRRPGNRKFEYHDAQRYAIETLIWLYEVAKVCRRSTNESIDRSTSPV